MYGKAIGLYNKHCKYSEQWNPWYPFQSAHDFQQAQSVSQETKTCIDHLLRCGLDNFNIKSCQSEDALRKLLSELDFQHCNDIWIAHYSHIIGILHYSDIFKCTQFISVHLPCQTHFDFGQVYLSVLEICRIYCVTNTGDWRWDSLDRLPACQTIVPDICVFTKTHLRYVLANSFPDCFISQLVMFQMASAAHLKCVTAVSLGWSPDVWKMPKILTRHGSASLELYCPHSEISKYVVTAWYWIVLKESQDNVICFWPPWAGEFPEFLMDAQVFHGSCPLCGNPGAALTGHCTFWQLNNRRNHHVHLELLNETHIEGLHNLGVDPIRNQFWQYLVCNVYWLWLPDELHKRLMGLVKYLLNWLLKYLKATNVEDQFDNWFTSVPHFPGHLRYSKPFDPIKRSASQGTESQGIIRTLAVMCAPFLDCYKDNWKTVMDTASDEKVMGAV